MHRSMHPAFDFSLHVFAAGMLGLLALWIAVLLAASFVGNPERRRLNRIALANNLQGNGWALLSFALKMSAVLVPRADRGVFSWLWIPPLVLALAGWTWKRRRRERRAETRYTRSLRRARRTTLSAPLRAYRADPR